MTFFRFDIGVRARRASRFFGEVRHELLKALMEEKGKGLSQQELADRLQIPRSQLNGRLAGCSALSLRALSNLAWALDREITIELRPRGARQGQNIAQDASSIWPSQYAINRDYGDASTNGGSTQIKTIRSFSEK